MGMNWVQYYRLILAIIFDELNCLPDNTIFLFEGFFDSLLID